MRTETVPNRIEVFRRAPQAIYHRRKRGAKDHDDDQKADTTAAQTQSSADSESVVNLRSTLELFGSAAFKLQLYLERRVGQNKSEHAHKQELANRKALLSGALKTFVTEHYQMFIHTSQEIENIETDLSTLHSLLSQYKVSLKKLQDVDTCRNIGTATEENSANISVSSKKSQPYIGFINELVEELNMLRYEKKLEQATALIESAYKRQDHGTDDAAKTLLNAERDKVVNLSIEMFQNQSLKANERRRYLVYVIRLGQIDKALTLFFEQRSAEIRSTQSQPRPAGDLTSFITDMSGNVFSSIGKGWMEFKRIFREPTRDSSFLAWALSELSIYCSAVRNQVFLPDTPFRTACQCTYLVILACKMLEKQQLRLSPVLEKFFIDDLRSALRKYLTHARQTIASSVRGENWVTDQTWIKQANNFDLGDKGSDQLDITKSARTLYDTVHQYIIDMKLIVLNPALFNPTVNDLLLIATNGIRIIFEEYLVQMATASQAPEITQSQGAAMIGNARCLAEDLYPRLIKQLAPRLQKRREFDDILAFQEQLNKFYRAQQDFFAHQRVDVP